MSAASALAPFLLCLVPLLFSGAPTLGLIPWQHWIRPAALSLGVTGFLFLALRLRMGSARRALPVTTALVALFLWPGPLVSTFLWLGDLGLHPGLAGGMTGILWTLLVGGLGSWTMRRSPEDPKLVGLGEFLQVFCLLVFLSGVFQVSKVCWTLDPSPLALRHQEEWKGKVPSSRPDVYWIILDAYPRRDILTTVFGLDNSDFYRALEARGFTLTHESSSNYATTAPSLASAFNLDYLAPSPDQLVPNSQAYYAPLVSMVRANRLTSFMAAQGYRTVGLSSGAYLMDRGNYHENRESYWSSLEYLLIGNTVADLLTTDYQFEVRRRNLVDVLRVLPTLASREQPVFALTHVVAPHPPFVMGPRGESSDPGYPRYTPLDYGGVFNFQMGEGWYQENFRKQLLGVNHLVLEAIDGILARSDRQAVIMLHGDHGSASKRTRDPNTEDLRERFAILSAFRFPGSPETSLYPSLSLVNAGRVMLNRVFECGLPLFPDQTFHTEIERGFGVREIAPAILRPAR